MSNVIDILANAPHLSGMAMCTACGHEWSVACNVGTETLECPSCKRYHGVMKGPVIPSEAWKCKCGNQLFYMTREGFVCRLCGKESRL